MKQRSGFIARHKPVRKVSAKRLAAEPRAKWSSITAPRKPLPKKNAKRQAREFPRIYHSQTRKRWIRSQGCIACKIFGWLSDGGPIDNAHTTILGAGIKAGYETIVPLCRQHHRLFDQYKPPFDLAAIRSAFRRHARTLNGRWNAFLEHSA